MSHLVRKILILRIIFTSVIHFLKFVMKIVYKMCYSKINGLN